jgi:transcriptional regulator with XRE-family HTH domain
MGLSQEEVAYLLGVESGSKVSRYEGFVREPGLETILALELIFQKPAHELFGGPFHKIEHAVGDRAKKLLVKLSKGKTDRSTGRKLKTLKAIIARSANHS